VFVPKQSWLDRIVRGRAWIPVLGLLLVAIVGLRVEVLKLTSGVGTQIQQASELQSSNAALRSSVSELSGNQRIEQLAESMGMVMPGPMDVHFVPVSAGTHLTAAIRAIHTPESDTFLSGLAAERDADETSVTKAVNTSAVGDLAAPASGYTTSSASTDTGATTGAGDSAISAANTTGSTTDIAPAASSAASATAGVPTTGAATDAGATELATNQTSATGGGTASSSTTTGDSTTGDSTSGDSTSGGSTSGGSTSGDSTSGDSTSGGSTSGGSALAG
jgi:cell division protein FtsL